MSNLLLILGIIFIGLALFKGRAQSAGESKDLAEFRQVRDELLEAKKEVGSLLEQLEQVSERIVEEITAKVKEVKKLEVRDVPRSTESNMHQAGTEAEQELRQSIAQMRESSRTRESRSGKTIMFPRVKGAVNAKPSDHDEKKEIVREMPPKHQMVYAMSQLGYSEDEIAKQMKIGKGEVSLMLQLKRKGEEANG